MKKFNADDALKGAPVKLKNGLKAYIKKCCEDNVFVYSGYVAGEKGDVKSWNRQGKEYFNCESSFDIVAMWEDEEQEDTPEANAQANAQANLEANLEAGENIFEKALRNNLQLRCKKQDLEKYYYCIAKTENIDYLLENKKDGTIERLSSFVEGLDWSVVEHKLPKVFIPNEGEEFWFIHPTELKHKQKAKFVSGSMFYQGMVNVGLVFRTEEDAEQALRFLRSNIEVNNGEEQK